MVILYLWVSPFWKRRKEERKDRRKEGKKRRREGERKKKGCQSYNPKELHSTSNSNEQKQDSPLEHPERNAVFQQLDWKGKNSEKIIMIY